MFETCRQAETTQLVWLKGVVSDNLSQQACWMAHEAVKRCSSAQLPAFSQQNDGKLWQMVTARTPHRSHATAGQGAGSTMVGPP